MKTLSIIIPAYNEEKTIIPILEKIVAVQLTGSFQKEIVIVNDCSTDNTEDIILRFKTQHPEMMIHYFKQPVNQGKGAAIRKGLDTVSGDYVIIQDADLEYDPEDYNVLLAPMEKENLQVIYGSRFLRKENRHSYFSFYIGGQIISIATNLLFRQHLTDEPTCYKLFKTSFLKSIPLRCKGFEFCPEVTAKTAKRGIKIKEVPIHYYPRSVEEGKKIKWTDGLEALWTLFKYRFMN